MPTYQYACTNPDCRHEFEQFQSFTDAALSECPVCAERVRKVYGSVGVVFKGSGFYRNDSRDSKTSTAAPSSDGAKADSGKSDASSSDGAKTGSAKSDSTKADSAKSGSGKSETTKTGSGSGGSGGSPGSSSASSGGSSSSAGSKAAAK